MAEDPNNQYQDNNQYQQYNQYQQPQNNGQYQGQPQMPPQGDMPQHGLYMTLSILELLFCNLITGILGLVFTNEANSAYRIGDIATSESKKKSAKMSLIIGAVISAVIAIICVIFVGVITNSMLKALGNLPSDSIQSESQVIESSENYDALEKAYDDANKKAKKNDKPKKSDKDCSDVLNETVNAAEETTEMTETTESASVSSETSGAKDTQVDGVMVCGYQAGDIEATGFTTKGTGKGHVCVYVVANRASTPLEVTGTVTFYGADGKVVDTSDVMTSVPASGCDFTYDYCETEFAKAEITFTSEANDYINPASLTTEVTQLTEDEVTVNITNAGSTACDSPYAMAMFCDSDGNAVELETGYCDAESIAPGETVSMTISSYDYDTAPYKSCIVLAHANEE